MLPEGLSFGLGSLPLLSDAKTRSISAENPDGSVGGGARAEPDCDDPHCHPADLGRGWKVRPAISLPAGSTTTLAQVAGPGVIQHIWMTSAERNYTDAVLRFYWDGEDTPSIEAPLGDFFACGHGVRTHVNSLPVAVNSAGGFNCYWPMPFREGARITIENSSHQDGGLYYQISYALTKVPAEAAYFHAQYRRAMTTREYPEHVLLEGVKGAGHYVGTYLAWTQMSNGWWGEGEIKFYMDGDAEFPTICGTGTEDYFGGAWCFREGTYSTAFMGYPLHAAGEGQVPRHGLYRWHVMDPIRFEKDLKVTIQALGWWPGGKYEPLTDDIASVAYWYQAEPHATGPSFPSRQQRFVR